MWIICSLQKSLLVHMFYYNLYFMVFNEEAVNADLLLRSLYIIRLTKDIMEQYMIDIRTYHRFFLCCNYYRLYFSLPKQTGTGSHCNSACLYRGSISWICDRGGQIAGTARSGAFIGIYLCHVGWLVYGSTHIFSRQDILPTASGSDTSFKIQDR